MSAHDCAEGGLAVALAECCFNPRGALGAEVALPAGNRLDALLFGESQSRILLSVPASSLPRLEAICADRETPHRRLGKVGGGRLKIQVGQEAVLNSAVEDLMKPWSQALPDWMV